MHPLQIIINSKFDDIIQIRRRIHQHPELKFEEFQTAKLVIETLHSFGIDSVVTLAKTGVVATIHSGNPG